MQLKDDDDEDSRVEELGDEDEEDDEEEDGVNEAFIAVSEVTHHTRKTYQATQSYLPMLTVAVAAKRPVFAFSCNIYDGSRLTYVVLTACFEPRNRDSDV